LTISYTADQNTENTTSIILDDSIKPITNNDTDLSIEFANSIEPRGPPVDENVSLTTSEINTYATLDEIAESSEMESIHSLNAPDLPGLVLVDPDISSWEGQIFYLDFDGTQDVIYNGPVTIGPFDVPAFEAPGELAGQEDIIISKVLSELEQTFTGMGIIFTTEQPSVGTEYSTIYIGGDDTAFSEYGSFLGFAEQVDVGNENRMDEGLVFSSKLCISSIDSYATTLANIIAHETGHLLGYEHVHAEAREGLLQSVAEDDYPYKDSTPDEVDPWNFYTRECTSFVAWRMNRDSDTRNAPYYFTNNMLNGHWGNAGTWDDNAISLGFIVNDIPEVGAIGHWNAGEPGASVDCGHVAYVENVNADNTVDISEYNWVVSGEPDYAYHTRSNISPPRFIHLIKFNIGDKVEANDTVNVRSAPGGENIGQVIFGDTGNIIGNSTGAIYEGNFYKWYEVAWNSGLSGWSVESGLDRISSLPPTVDDFDVDPRMVATG